MERRMAQAIALLLALGGIFYGVNRGEASLVLGKAIRICMECIGLG